jgi:hypothetical protein
MGKSSNEAIRFPSVNAFPKTFSKNFSAGSPVEKWRAEKIPRGRMRKKNFQKNAVSFCPRASPWHPFLAPGP